MKMKKIKKNSKKSEKRKIDFRYNFGVYLGFLKDYKWMALFVLFMVLIQEFIHVVDKFLFKLIIDNGTLFSAGELLRSEFIRILVLVVGVFAVISIISSIINWLKLHFINRIESGMIRNLKEKFFNHILGLDYNFHTTHKTGSLISRLSRGAGSVERLTDVLLFNFVTLIFQMIVVTLSLIYFDPVSALVVFLTTTIFIVYSVYIQRLQEDSNLEAIKNEDIEKGNVGDVFTNIDSVKYYGKEKFIEERFGGLIEKTRRAYITNWDYWKWTSSGQSLILAIGTFFVLYFPMIKFLDGGATLGTITFIYTIYLSLVGQMFGFVHGVRGFYRSMADFQDLFEYKKVDNVIKDPKVSRNLEIKEGVVEFKNVNFKYGKRDLFKNFNLRIESNEKVALVGHSGCGKTTLVKLLNRFYDVNSGEILIDGENIKSFDQSSLRGNTGIVPQECILFDDTIYNNIKFAKMNATKDEVLAAIRFAQLDKIIENFPKKSNTIVGERGVKLSGGEKQRVSIARAILANKRVLVLDEATSALDSRTEHEIQRDLLKLLKGRTSIIIAHRLSTIMHSDRIIVLDNGKIVEEGSHDVLLKKKGEYYDLWNLQKGGYLADEDELEEGKETK
ncbi:ABC transporter ATP-binding protein [Candidatus Pacearchaeota archaeon]|nr:ABC transporter ATP-binding protein [Candidatus Pacearchaeota archaeon]